jgi:hypothetical protein
MLVLGPDTGMTPPNLDFGTSGSGYSPAIPLSGYYNGQPVQHNPSLRRPGSGVLSPGSGPFPANASRPSASSVSSSNSSRPFNKQVSSNQYHRTSSATSAATNPPVDVLGRGSSVLDRFDDYEPDDYDNSTNKTPYTQSFHYASKPQNLHSASMHNPSMPPPSSQRLPNANSLAIDDTDDVETYTPNTTKFLQDSFGPPSVGSTVDAHLTWDANMNNMNKPGSYTGPSGASFPIPSGSMPALADDGMPVLSTSLTASDIHASHAPPYMQAMYSSSAPSYPSSAPKKNRSSSINHSPVFTGSAGPRSNNPPPDYEEQYTDDIPLSAQTAEERRARRLARNRESARQSRRRKKEYLALLGEKVKITSDEMDAVRRAHLDICEASLATVAQRYTAQLSHAHCDVHRTLKELWDATSPATEERSEAASFQWRTASNTLLPPHRKFVQWLNVQNDTFYKKNKQTAAERVSSKQIGERLTSEGRGGKADSTQILWPLFCYEMSFSYDQEERLVAAYKKNRELPDLALHGFRMRQSEVLLDRVGDGVKTMMERAERREEGILFQTLNAKQAAALKVYCAKNRGRIRAAFHNVGLMTPDEFARLTKPRIDERVYGEYSSGRVIVEETATMKQLYEAVERLVH